jgi:hypothetical protein
MVQHKWHYATAVTSIAHIENLNSVLDTESRQDKTTKSKAKELVKTFFTIKLPCLALGYSCGIGARKTGV